MGVWPFGSQGMFLICTSLFRIILFYFILFYFLSICCILFFFILFTDLFLDG